MKERMRADGETRRDPVLTTPQPRLRTGFFSVLSKNTIPDNNNATVKQCCTSAGVAKHGKPIALDADVKVDVVVIGSCAVDVNTGARLGKGEGFAELEYGILRMMGAIDENTPVVTSVHDEQLVDDIPTSKLLRHDVPVAGAPSNHTPRHEVPPSARLTSRSSLFRPTTPLTTTTDV